MSPDSYPMKDPANSHFTKADPAATESLLEESFKMRTCHK